MSNKKYSDDIINSAIELILSDFNDRHEMERYKGSYSDGGLSSVKNTINSFMKGVLYEKSGEIPDFLIDYIKKVEATNDPEYSEYLRLKSKFK